MMQDSNFANENRVLTSWKEIAAYLGKGVRTVQRWEKDFGLPVRRPSHSDKSAIIARTRDLDIWVAMRCSTREVPDGQGNHLHMLAVRSSLLAGMNTAHMLRATNLALVTEMRQALVLLHGEIARMQGDEPDSAAEPSETARTLLPQMPVAGAA